MIFVGISNVLVLASKTRGVFFIASVRSFLLCFFSEEKYFLNVISTDLRVVWKYYPF